MDLLLTYRLVLAILSVGMITSTLEALYARADFDQGIFSWRILRLRVRRGLRPAADSLFQSRAGTVALLLARLVAIGVALCFEPRSLGWYLPILVIFVSLGVMTWRRYLGGDGSDQMSVILCGVLLLCTWPGASDRILRMGLAFIAVQSALAYFAAGVAKAVSPEWRSGSAIRGIFGTFTYGSPRAFAIVSDSRLMQLAMCWSVIGFEVLFPLALAFPPPVTAGFVAVGVGFHLGTAVIMGLNSFLWAFGATYPAVLYLSDWLHGVH